MYTQAHTGTLTPYAHTGTYRHTHTLCTHRHTHTLCTHRHTHTQLLTHTTHQRASYCQSLQKNMYKNNVKVTQIMTHVSKWKAPYTHVQSLLQWLKCTMLNQRTEINHKRSLNPAHCIGPSTVPRTVATPLDLNTSNHMHSMTHRHTHTVTHTQTHTHSHTAIVWNKSDIYCCTIKSKIMH